MIAFPWFSMAGGMVWAAWRAGYAAWFQIADKEKYLPLYEQILICAVKISPLVEMISALVRSL